MKDEISQTNTNLDPEEIIEFEYYDRINKKKVVIKEEGKEDKITWTRVWNSFDEYKNSDNGLINQASFYASIFGGTEQIPN